MPTIFDNIDKYLLDALKNSLEVSYRADYCVGYFNLRGWRAIAEYIENFNGEKGNRCRLLIGMQKRPHQELKTALRLDKENERIDNKTAIKLKKQLAKEFREQLLLGAPNNEDEQGLRKLVEHLKAKKLIVKLFLRYNLHAKLYLNYRNDRHTPIIGYLGSSNLTMSGLSVQGELNINILEQDAAKKLSDWFNDRWNDRWCIDISDELIEIIENSWVQEKLIKPYYIYLKMVYHLSQEARTGLSEFKIPKKFRDKLFEYQTAAVQIAAHYLNKRGGVVIGDVVGLGKTMMATAVAKIFEEDWGTDTLIICPKNLEKMWISYREQYSLRGKVVPITTVITKLPDLRRYRLVIIDESHNLRNREGKRYTAIKAYIERNKCKCILLTATPYNKEFIDLSNQLRLFIPEDQDLGIRPEALLHNLGETEFKKSYPNTPLRSLAAFEKSLYTQDWQELMRLFLVRRTRKFIQYVYAEKVEENGRRYLNVSDGTRNYFPERIPKTLKFDIDEQYSKLYDEETVETINKLELPRYGLGKYISDRKKVAATEREKKIIEDLSRAGKRLMGFCRTNLFKRLESSGSAFALSIERHILRNYVYLHAVENNLEIPIGTQDPQMLDTSFFDGDADDVNVTQNIFDNESITDESEESAEITWESKTHDDFQKQAKEIYQKYQTLRFKKRFKWINAQLFKKKLKKHLIHDNTELLKIYKKCKDWDPAKDAKLKKLHELITKDYPDDKILIFSQFADTVKYLEKQLTEKGIKKFSGVTGSSSDPTSIAWRFSPKSNEKEISLEEELRVVISTDVLSEGQNLQDCFIVVNYDLPWAIIRLIQRAGRVDRIGQQSEEIYCYSFLPAEGVENIIRLRTRLVERLQENAKVVGTDEIFFGEKINREEIANLYNESSGILDDQDTDVDLSSQAYGIWKSAIAANPELEKIITKIPQVAYSTKSISTVKSILGIGKPEGVLVYTKTPEGTDALAWINKDGINVTESQFVILKAAECNITTDPLPKHEKHHELVEKGVKYLIENQKSVGGQLGRKNSAKYRTYTRLDAYAQNIKDTLLDEPILHKALETLYKFPLKQSAIDTLNRQLRAKISNADLAKLVITLYEEDRLCIVHEDIRSEEPQIICSMGIFEKNKSYEKL